jgi:hypothetical protein
LGKDGLKIMTQPTNNIYETREWPKNFLEVAMIALKKKLKATKCSSHCVVCLIAHTAKLVVRILRTGAGRKTEDVLVEDLEEEKELGMQLGC